MKLCNYYIALVIFSPSTTLCEKFPQKYHREHIAIPTKYHPNTNTHRPHILIWIHGTKITQRHFNNSPYNNHVCLYKYNSLPKDAAEYRSLTALARYYPEVNVHTNAYALIWSGKLNIKKRAKTAKIFLDRLCKLVSTVRKQYHQEPYIHVVTHSHGGNIVLHLAEYIPSTNIPFYIDQVTLLACPVQSATMYLVNHPIFLSIHAMYSNLDFVQVIAPQIRNIQQVQKAVQHPYPFCLPPFSQRIFPEDPKLIQAKIRCNGRAILHKEFALPRFLNAIPTITHQLNYCKEHHINATHCLLDITFKHAKKHYFLTYRSNHRNNS